MPHSRLEWNSEVIGDDTERCLDSLGLLLFWYRQ
jgi:hypothetical protein